MIKSRANKLRMVISCSFMFFFSERYVLAPAIGTVAAQPLLPTTSTRTTTRKANVELVEEMPIEP